MGNAEQITANITGLTDAVTLDQLFSHLGQRTQTKATIGTADDFQADYLYDDPAGRLTRIKQTSQQNGNAVADKRVDFAYDLAGNFDTITRYHDLAGNTVVARTDYTFDAKNRVTDIDHKDGAGTPNVLSEYSLVYDGGDRVADFDVASPLYDNESSDFGYDSTNQLTDADHTTITDENYVYDDNGNRTNNGYVVGTNNQLASDGTYRYAYDEEGNRTLRYIDVDASSSLSLGDTNITVCEWDHRNRLTKVSEFADYDDYDGDDPDLVVEYFYNYLNQLVRKTLDSNSDGTPDASTVFVHDGNQIVLQFDVAGSGSADGEDLSHRYLWGAGVDQLLADEQVHYDDTLGVEDFVTDHNYFVLADHLNTVRDVVEYVEGGGGATNLVKHLGYDSFGNVEIESANGIKLLFGYTGRMFDADTGLQNNLNRWYDAPTGRWLTEDPIRFAAKDPNLYRYCGGSPTNAIDPSGLVKASISYQWGKYQGAYPGSVKFGEFPRPNGLSEKLNKTYDKYRKRKGSFLKKWKFDASITGSVEQEGIYHQFKGVPKVETSFYRWIGQRYFGPKSHYWKEGEDKDIDTKGPVFRWKEPDKKVSGPFDEILGPKSEVRCIECAVTYGDVDIEVTHKGIPDGAIAITNLVAIGLDFIPTAEVLENLLAAGGALASYGNGKAAFKKVDRLSFGMVICADGHRMVGLYNLPEGDSMEDWLVRLSRYHPHGGNRGGVKSPDRIGRVESEPKGAGSQYFVNSTEGKVVNWIAIE